MSFLGSEKLPAAMCGDQPPWECRQGRQGCLGSHSSGHGFMEADQTLGQEKLSARLEGQHQSSL